MPIPLASQSDTPCVLKNNVGEPARSTQPVTLCITFNKTPPNLPNSSSNTPTERISSPRRKSYYIGAHSSPSYRSSPTPAASPSRPKVGTHIRSGLWDSRQTTSTSSQVRTIKQSVCGTSRQERQRQALSLDTDSALWHSRQMSTSSQARMMEQFECHIHPSPLITE